MDKQRAHATAEELLEEMFSVPSVPSIYLFLYIYYQKQK
jgi:hypothetical protein